MGIVKHAAVSHSERPSPLIALLSYMVRVPVYLAVGGTFT